MAKLPWMQAGQALHHECVLVRVILLMLRLEANVLMRAWDKAAKDGIAGRGVPCFKRHPTAAVGFSSAAP